MPTPDVDIVLLTEGRYETITSPTSYTQNILDEDRLVTEALARRGLSAARVDWARSDVAWSEVPCAVFRTTWDYFVKLDAFRRWLDGVEGTTCLVNDASTVRWNIDKRYLLDLDAAGVAVVPTRIAEKGGATSLVGWAETLNAEEIVCKPVVSGSARNTFRVSQADIPAFEARFAELVAEEAMLVQPFQSAIVTRGEVTVVMIDGRPTHAVRKVAKAGDFRVQDNHGGTVHPHTPSSLEVTAAEAALAACPGRPLYGRVDLTHDAEGSPLVMEVELVEPELWFRYHPPAADALAEALARLL